jgi:hypothetical protein
MSVSRNLKTESGKATWEKVEQAASHAPQWVKDNVKKSASTGVKEPVDKEQSDPSRKKA